MKAKNRSDAALGCLLGACVGDAAGAVLEFLEHKPSLAEVNLAMKMPGGGVWQVAPGQITDDGELTLCLARALSSSSHFNLEKNAQNYAQWIQSFPFDIGYTTMQSLGCFASSPFKEICDKQGYAAGMTQAASQQCMSSKANGSLMRISPLGIWGHRFNDKELAHLAQQDARLSHPNESCAHAAACYVIAISNLIKKPGDRKTAFKCAQCWAIFHANEEVCDWLQQAQNNIKVPYYPHEGFVKIAFMHAFRHLWLETDYEEALRETLLGGGDTDTNACIVGGLIGAACGADAIPDDMKQPVLRCNTQQGKHPRPRFLSTTQIPTLAIALPF